MMQEQLPMSPEQLVQQELQQSLERERIAMFPQREMMVERQVDSLMGAMLTNVEGTPVAQIEADLGAIAVVLSARRQGILNRLTSEERAKYEKTEKGHRADREIRAFDLMFTRDEDRSEEDQSFLAQHLERAGALSNAAAFQVYMDQQRLMQEAMDEADEPDEDEESQPLSLSAYRARKAARRSRPGQSLRIPTLKRTAA